MKRFLILILFLSLNNIKLEAQGSGTPSVLRVKVDANGYLVVESAAQTNPVTSGVFNNRVLKTDASGNLLVVNTGGAFTSQLLAPTTPTDCSAQQYSFTSDPDTGMGYGGANIVKLCAGGLSVFHNSNTLFNIAVGTQALNVATGAENTALGYKASFLNTTGIENLAVGSFALTDNLTGSFNTAVGYGSGARNLGSQLTAVGFLAALSNTTGGFNTAVGIDAERATTTGGSNTSIGASALLSNITGSFNAAFGVGAGRRLTGSSNIAIGNEADAMPAASSNTLNIGNLLFGTGVDGTIDTISTGNVGIRTFTPRRTLDILRTTEAQLRLTHTDNSVYSDFLLSSIGKLTITPTGSDPSINIVGYLGGIEQTAPAAPAANGYRIFSQDNGAGKTQLCAIFATGAAQCFATEP